MENLTQSLHIGMLDERIEIQTATEAANAYGEIAKTWATTETLWARVEYGQTKADEDYVKATVKEYRPVLFTVRYRTNVTAKNRILYGGQYYDIRHIEHVGRKRFTIFESQLRV